MGSSSQLPAILGGPPLVESVLKAYRWIDEEAADHLRTLALSGNLSGFIAQKSVGHFGGEHVRKLEVLMSEYYRRSHAITFNSWTSGLEAIFFALDLTKGSEVIVTPWTMSATVSCIVNAGLVPHFVDINYEDFNISPKSIAEAIGPNTSAVMAVDLFGKPCDSNQIKKICEKSNLHFLIDSAQTPIATRDGKRGLDFAQAGGFSFNRHKHLQVGEGGVALTNDEFLANRLRGFRNHAEITMLDHEMPRYSPPVGHNLRMGEMEALLALKQFRKIDLHVQRRRTWGRYLADKIKTLQLSGLEIDIPSGQDEHDFYILPLRVKTDLLEVHKTSIVDALRAEGMVTVVGEYGGLENLKAFEKYPRGPLRNAKLAHEREFIGLYMCGHEYSRKYLDQIANAFERIWNHIHELPREKI